MRNLILLAVVLLLATLKIRAQDVQNLSPKELILAIKKSKPDTNRINLQLKLGSYYLFKPGEYKNDLDSAYNFFNQAAQLSDRLHEVDWHYKVLAMTGNYYAEAGDLKRCKQIFMQVLAYYRQKGNMNEEAATWEWLGRLYDSESKDANNKERLTFYQHARSLYLQNRDTKKAAEVLNSIADVKMANGQFDQVEKDMLQLLGEYKKSGYKNLQDVYQRLCNVEYIKGNYYRAMSYASEGIKSMKTSRDTTLASSLYQVMARSNFTVKKYDKALEWIRKAIIADESNFSFKCALVQTLINLNKTDEARVALNKLLTGRQILGMFDKLNLFRIAALYYDKINKNDLAILYYNRIVAHELKEDFNEASRNIWLTICYNEIAGVYLKAGQAVKAKRYIDNAALIFKKSSASLEPRHLVTFYHNLYKYDFITGSYRAGVRNLERRDKLQDSLSTVDKDNKIAELDIEYQTRENEQSIKDLHNKEVIQQAKLDKANLQRNITIGGIFLMILAGVLFYRLYGQKQAASNIIMHKNELLQRLVTEKEWLLKEVHHRVKNNLHTVICLLESQAAYLENDALKAIENSQHRIYAMSLIHQQLYQSDDIKTIDMANYIPELVKSLEDSFDISNRIQFKLHIEPVNLDISHAIPLGLIINEAVTNSIKYAFPDNRQGEISILLIDDGYRIKLELTDNGIGMPEIEGGAESGSLGLVLMKGLSEDIDANITIDGENGTRITIVFDVDSLNSGSNPSGDAIKKEVYL